MTQHRQTDVTSQLSQSAAELRSEMEELSTLADSFGTKLVTGLATAVVHGKSLSDIFKSIAQTLTQSALSSALKPLGNSIGSLFSGLFANAKGNAFDGGRLLPFADGGIVGSPTLFGMQGGLGLMGEAGPEAILPLARGADGALGVRAGGGASSVTINIQTPDVQSFTQSQNQVAALVSRALARAQRNM
jgi:lambda family phage tail tape measure protein